MLLFFLDTAKGGRRSLAARFSFQFVVGVAIFEGGMLMLKLEIKNDACQIITAQREHTRKGYQRKEVLGVPLVFELHQLGIVFSITSLDRLGRNPIIPIRRRTRPNFAHLLIDLVQPRLVHRVLFGFAPGSRQRNLVRRFAVPPCGLCRVDTGDGATQKSDFDGAALRLFGGVDDGFGEVGDQGWGELFDVLGADTPAIAGRRNILGGL